MSRTIPPGGPDQPGDLVHGVRTIEGTVTVSDGCPVLVHGEARSALLGSRAEGLKGGQRVRIVGTIAETSTPGHGGPGQAIRVTKITHLG